MTQDDVIAKVLDPKALRRLPKSTSFSSPLKRTGKRDFSKVSAAFRAVERL